MDAFKLGKQLAKSSAVIDRDNERMDKLRRLLLALSASAGASGSAVSTGASSALMHGLTPTTSSPLGPGAQA